MAFSPKGERELHVDDGDDDVRQCRVAKAWSSLVEGGEGLYLPKW